MNQLQSQEEWGVALPHWHAESEKYHVFSSFEPDFCTEMENNPPIGIPKTRWRLFFIPSIFWCTTEFSREIVINRIWREKLPQFQLKTFLLLLFFGHQLNLDRNIVSFQM